MPSTLPPVTEGSADFRVGGETYQTWYKVIGDLKSGTRPLVTLHGGPGSTHHYISPLADLVTKYDIPVVLYDQLGGGGSTYLPDKPASFWTPELFMDELENLVAHLGISSDYDLLGHSWGGMLAAQFAAQRPQAAAGVKRLIISDSPASMALWEEVAAKLVEGMPQDIQDTLKKHEDAGTTDSKEYHDAMMVFYAKHLCRVNPMPEDVGKSFELMEKYPVVYSTMCVLSFSIVDYLMLKHHNTGTAPPSSTSSVHSKHGPSSTICTQSRSLLLFSTVDMMKHKTLVSHLTSITFQKRNG